VNLLLSNIANEWCALAMLAKTALIANNRARVGHFETTRSIDVILSIRD